MSIDANKGLDSGGGGGGANASSLPSFFAPKPNTTQETTTSAGANTPTPATITTILSDDVSYGWEQVSDNKFKYILDTPSHVSLQGVMGIRGSG